MDRFTLFIDESGNLDVTNKFSKLYILCGCSIADERRRDIKIYADQIKFKYWGHTDIIFHSREIAMNTGDFEIFKENKKLKDEFLKDLLTFLNKISVIIFPVIVNKKEAKQKEWNDISIIKETSRNVILNFSLLLLSKKGSTGHIIIESSYAGKDQYYLQEFEYFVTPNLKEIDVDHQTMRKALTSISFVTKHNKDIEEQITDLYAYAAKCKYMRDFKKKKFEAESYEEKIIASLEQKLFNKPENAGEIKMELYNQIQPFCVLPGNV